MKNNEFQQISNQFGEIISSLENIQMVVMARLGSRCPSAVWLRLISCYVDFASLQFSDDYTRRFGNSTKNVKGGLSCNELSME
jgi:hypothetical protein